MEHMQEKDFDKLAFAKEYKDCKHATIVRLYYLGTHVEYGCAVCGARHSEKSFFDIPQK